MAVSETTRHENSLQGQTRGAIFSDVNELSTPKVLFCLAIPIGADLWETNFQHQQFQSQLFCRIDAAETILKTILSGDRNITNGTPVRNGILELTQLNLRAGQPKCTSRLARRSCLMAASSN